MRTITVSVRPTLLYSHLKRVIIKGMTTGCFRIMTTRVKGQAQSCWQLQETGTGTHKDDDEPGKKRHVTESNNSSGGTRIISLLLTDVCGQKAREVYFRTIHTTVKKLNILYTMNWSYISVSPYTPSWYGFFLRRYSDRELRM